VSGRDRIRYEAFICCAAPVAELLEVGAHVIERLSALYGGASAEPVTGAWAENGNTDHSAYRGVVVEPGIKILLSVTRDRVDAAYRDLVAIITAVVVDQSLPVRYVHVDRFDNVQAMHFDITSGAACGSD
jgi:hypothetical protein